MRITTARLIFCLAASGLAAGCSSNGSSSSSSSEPAISAVDKSFLRGIGSYDQNHDRVVTCEEWRSAASGMFTKANRSGSGALAGDEFQSLATTDRIFLVATAKYYDTNNDGKVDKKEFVERPNPAFTYADADKDCRLTEAEQTASRGLSAQPTVAATSRHTSITSGAPNSSSTGPGNNNY